MRISDWSSDVCSSDLHSHDVTLIHRRDTLRAEKILQERLFANPKISVIWDTAVEEFVGEGTPVGLTGLKLRNTKTGEAADFATEGAFVAIGHSPATAMFQGKLTLDGEGYIQVGNGRGSRRERGGGTIQYRR